MFFTQEDFKKIERWLQRNSVKDTEFNEAEFPLRGSEEVAIIQGNHNKRITLKEFANSIKLLGVSDFVNISESFNAKYIDLEQAISYIPYIARKLGQVITFLNEDGYWNIYQYQGEDLNTWNNSTLWKNILESIIINYILPDEEDLTITNVDNNGNTRIKFKDKTFDKNDYSGLGRVFLRKNIVTLDNNIKINLFSQQMLLKENTIYIIQYDYDLNNSIVKIPNNSVLLFKGGSLSNGTIVGNTTIIDAPQTKIFNYNIDIQGTWNIKEWYPEWYGAKGDGITDDSEAFNKLSGRNIKLSQTDYAVSNIVLGDNTQVIGSGVKYGFKQLDNSSGDCITMFDWGNGVLRDFKIVGGKNIAEINYKQALLKLKANRGDESLNKSIIEHIYIENGEHCGLSILGNGDVDNGITCSWAWVFSITECWLFNFGQYAIYSHGTDNRFNNLKVGGGALANVLEEGSSNIWENIKSDSLPGKAAIAKYNNDYEALLKSVDGSSFTVNHGVCSQFINIDIQSSRFAGIKFLHCRSCNISVIANNCGYGLTGDDMDEFKQYCPGVYLDDCNNNIINIGSDRHSQQIYGLKANGYTNSMNIINFAVGLWNLEQSQFDTTYDDITRLKSNNIVNTSFYDTLINNPRLITLRSLVPWDMSWVGNSTGIIEEDTNALIPPTFSVKVDRSAATSSYDTMFIKGNISVKAGHTYLFTTIMDVVSNDGTAVDIANRQSLPYYIVSVAEGKVTIFNPHILYKSNTLNLVTNKRIVNYVLFTPDTDTKAVISCLHVNKKVIARATQPNLYDLTQDLDIRVSNVRSDYDFSYLYKYIFAYSGYDKGLEIFTDLPVYTNINHNHITGNVSQIENRGIDGDSFFDPSLKMPFYQANGKWFAPNGFPYESVNRHANNELNSEDYGYSKYNSVARMPLYWDGTGWVLVKKADIGLIVFENDIMITLVSLERYNKEIHDVVGVAIRYGNRYIAVAKKGFNTIWGPNVGSDIGITIDPSLMNYSNYNRGYRYNQDVIKNVEGILDSENAVSICHNYSYIDSNGFGIPEGKWYLPSIGEMIFIMENRELINYALSLIGGDTINEYSHWTINDVRANGFDTAIYCTKYPDGVTISANYKETASIYFRPITLLNDKLELGITEDRPILNKIDAGYRFFDETLSKPIWWTGEKWVDATGADV